MKKMVLIFLATLVAHSFAADIKEVFPLTCALEFEQDPKHVYFAQTFHDLDEVDTLAGAPFFWNLSKPNEDDDAKYVFGYIDGKFRAQYRRQENAQEKIARANVQAEQLRGGGYDTIHIIDLETVYASNDELAEGKEFRFVSKETPNVALVCQKGLIDQDDDDKEAPKQ